MIVIAAGEMFRPHPVIGFVNPVAARDAGSADAPADAGDARDAYLGNVCGAGVASCMVADSQQDFAIVQGANHWFYGFWDITNDGDGTYQQADFQELALINGLWRPPDWIDMPDPHFTWAYLAAWGGHPGSFPIMRAPVRRWVSPVGGPAIVRVAHAKSDPTGGDGTRAVLIVDGAVLLTRDVAGTDGVGFVQDVPVVLAIGSRVDLMLHFIGDDGVDTTTQTMEIRSP